MKTKLTLRLVFSLLVLGFSLFTFCSAQTISTVAGNYAFGAGYYGDGGPATAAQLNGPNGVAFDASGNLYIAEMYNQVIRKVNTSGIISTVAGNHAHGAGYSGDGGPATAAELNYPYGVALDASDNLYIADMNNNIIRKVNTSGTISTVAGNHIGGYNGDGGPATAADLSSPAGVALDVSGNLCIIDWGNSVIRMVNTSGIISTVAGNYILGPGYSGDGGPATAAELYYPEGITFDASGNLYIADNDNYIIRKVNTSGTISTVAGNNGYGAGYSGDGGPATGAELYAPYGVTFDRSGNLYIADFNLQVVRMVNTFGIISTIAGNVSFGYGYSGDGGPATAAELEDPSDVACDASGNLYIADWGNNIIRKVIGLIATDINHTSFDGAGLIIYPNPNNGIFTMQSSVISNQLSVEIYNVLGEKVLAETLQPQTPKGALNEINLTNQPNGVYLYRVTGENGSLEGEGKVVVEK